MLTGIVALVSTFSALQQPVVIQYRITLHSSRNIDRTSSGEDARGGTYSAVAFVSARMTTEPGGRFAHVEIDSVRCSGTGMMSMAFDSIVGRNSRSARYDFPIGSRLEVVPVPSISNTLTNTLAQTALMLFPTIDRGAEPGATWSDSLDTSMNDPASPNRPIITRWKVTRVAGDTATAEGDVRGTVASSGRVIGTGLVWGTRHMTAVAGGLRMQTSTVTQETLMVGQDATAITRGTASTSLEIVALTTQGVPP